MSDHTGVSRTISVAITGASGSAYALRLIECLVQAECKVYVMVSKAAHVVISHETEHKLSAQAATMEQQLTGLYDANAGQIRVFGKEDWMSPVASGSGPATSMVVCPCSTGTLSAIATGASNNLIERAADVVLKERRQLILVPRETPFSRVHLKNMLELTEMGAIVLPASPGFYHQPQQVSDLVDFIVARILDQLGIDQTMIKRWGRDGV